MTPIRKIVIFATVTTSLAGTSSTMAAPCPVPNAIANGQVADASKVMQNFEAVADCAEASVTTTGTPTAGSIATFSSSSSITSGNLTGDVTTTGGTATTLSNTGVTPGTYNSATISVDAKGRVLAAANGSGGAGGNWWFSPPLASQFTLGSGDSNTLILTNDLDAGLLVDGGNPVSGDVNRIAYQTVTNKNSPWDLKVRIEGVVPADNWSGFGIVMRDSISGRISSLTMQGDAAISALNWYGYSGYAGVAATFFPRVTIKWFRIQHDGTQYNYFVSAEGKLWIKMGFEANTSWLSNKADQIGISINYNRSGGIRNSMNIQYYSFTQ